VDGLTTAFEFHLERGALQSAKTTYPRARCDAPADAVARLAAGFPVMVAESDAHRFRILWDQEREFAARGEDCA